MSKSSQQSAILVANDVELLHLNLTSFNELRKQKYKLRNVLRTLDASKYQVNKGVDHNGLINVDAFLTIASDNQIHLNTHDRAYLKNRLSQNGKIKYEEVIKDLGLIAMQADREVEVHDQSLGRFEPDIMWVLRSNQQNASNKTIKDILLKNTLAPQNPLAIKKKFIKYQPPRSLDRSREQPSVSDKNYHTSDGREGQRHFDKKKNSQVLPHVPFESANQHRRDTHPFNTFSSAGSKTKMEILSPYISGQSPEMQKLLTNILLIKKDKQYQADQNMKLMSAGSKKINILKNKQNKIYIKSVIPSDKIQQQKNRIRKYMKENEVDITHLNAIVGAFLDCDENRTGVVTKKQLFEQIQEQNLQFPPDFLFNLIQDMQLNTEDESEETLLSYSNLRNIIEIYSNLPLFLKQILYCERFRGDSNNSDNFKASMDYNTHVGTAQNKDRTNKLFRYINFRVIEKFKDFRMGFRSMDKDFGGTLDFKEFIQGLEGIGIKFTLNDYKLVFESIDYDQKGVIDFHKFCLINTDKKDELEHLRTQHAQKIRETQQSLSKPPLPPLSVQGRDFQRKNPPVFDEGKIPKNKDINAFAKDVKQNTPTKDFMNNQRGKLKPGLVSYQDLSSEHSFGVKNSKSHDMIAILTNSYQDELNQASLDALKKTLHRKPLPPPKVTYAQKIREKANKLRYHPLNRSSSIVEGDKVSVGTYSIPGKKHRNRSSSHLSVQGINRI